MITRIRIEGESETSERLHHEFSLVRQALSDLFAQFEVTTFLGHTLLEKCNGSPDVSVAGNWIGRSVVHLDTQKLNEQIPPVGPYVPDVG